MLQPAAEAPLIPMFTLMPFGVPSGVPNEFKARNQNTAPDGTVTKVLQGLTTLSSKLAENFGINDPFTDLMEKWFGRWKGYMTSILTSLVVVARVLIFVVYGTIPCVR
jgi:hypothetical protein